jgi:hypothetical protein
MRTPATKPAAAAPAARAVAPAKPSTGGMTKEEKAVRASRRLRRQLAANAMFHAHRSSSWTCCTTSRTGTTTGRSQPTAGAQTSSTKRRALRCGLRMPTGACACAVCACRLRSRLTRSPCDAGRAICRRTWRSTLATAAKTRRPRGRRRPTPRGRPRPTLARRRSEYALDFMCRPHASREPGMDHALYNVLHPPHSRVFRYPPCRLAGRAAAQRSGSAKPRPSPVLVPCRTAGVVPGVPRWRRRASAPCCGCSTSSCGIARPPGACAASAALACAHLRPAQRGAVPSRRCVHARHAFRYPQHVHGRERAACRCATTVTPPASRR